MKYVFALVTVITLMWPFYASADKNQKHPIDKAEGACIDKDGSTAGMANCGYKAYDAWDKELNGNYNALMKELTAEEKKLLRAAQKKWLDYRDEEFRLIDAVYANLKGTMFIPMRVGERIAVVKERALKLKDFLDLLEEER